MEINFKVRSNFFVREEASGRQVLRKRMDARTLCTRTNRPDLLLRIMTRHGITCFPMEEIGVTRYTSMFQVIAALSAAQFQMLNPLILQYPMICVRLSTAANRRVRMAITIIRYASRLTSTARNNSGIRIRTFVNRTDTRASLRFEFRTSGLAIFKAGNTDQLTTNVAVANVFRFSRAFVTAQLRGIRMLRVKVVAIPWTCFFVIVSAISKVSCGPIIHFVVFKAQDRFNGFIAINERIRTYLPYPSIVIIRGHSIRNGFGAFVFHLSRVDRVTTCSQDKEGTCTLRRINNFLGMVLGYAKRTSSRRNRIRARIPYEEVFPPRFNVERFKCVMANSVTDEARIVEANYRTSPNLVEVGDLIKNLSMACARFRSVCPIRLIRGLFLAGIPSYQCNKVDIPLISLYRA